MIKYSLLIILVTVASLIAGCDSLRSPDVISFKKIALYPEGIEYDSKRNRFLVTSMRTGIVGEVSDNGSYKPFITDKHFVSAVGIRIDIAGDRVLVCNADPGVSVHTIKKTRGKLTGLGIYQLSSGRLLKYIDLAALSKGGGHFCNDIGLDSVGNAYVTDSYSPIIYKIDLQNNASILLNDQRFVGEGFNLNGIVHKKDYLLVAKYNEGILFKVPLKNPQKFTQVKLDQKMVGADGLLWTKDGALIVIANMTTNKIFKLRSADNWASARVVATADTGPVFATTGVLRKGSIYVLDAMLHVLFNPKTTKHTETFNIRKHKL